MRITTTLLLGHVILGKQLAKVLDRRNSGWDIPREIKIIEIDDDTITVKIPGHKEASGYDRMMSPPTQYDYVPVRTVTCRIIERLPDYFDHKVIVIEETT